MVFDLNKIEKLQGYDLVLLIDNIYKDADGYFLYIFFIYKPNCFKKIGRVTLRMGESEDIQYLGNMGYCITKRHRRKNYATNACKVVLEYLKAQGITDITITTNFDNKASRRVCEKLGGVQVGTVSRGRNTKLVYVV